jgi:hypothetical protein
LKRGKELKSWADGICLLDEWFPFTRFKPCLAHDRWMLYVPFPAKIMGIYHYRLGETIGLNNSPN